MGQQTYLTSESKNTFVKALLRDVSALEHMLQEDMFETDVIRIGAEQEVVLVDNGTYKPSLLGPKILEQTTHESWLVSELAKFNLELNLSPQVFRSDCLTAMEKELVNNLDTLRSYLSQHDIDYILTGILPTLHKYHLHIDEFSSPSTSDTPGVSALLQFCVSTHRSMHQSISQLADRVWTAAMA